MTKRTSAHVELAQRLLEASRVGAARGDAAALYATLAGRLAPLVGTAGFQTVFGRGLKLTRAEFAELAEILAGVDAAYETPRCHEHVLARLSELEPARGSEVTTALFGEALALMGALIGERLVWQVLRPAVATLEQSAFKETK